MPEEQIDSVLPKIDGNLSIPSSSIAATSLDVCKVMKKSCDFDGSYTRKCGNYQYYTAKEKVEIAKKALECGIVCTILHYAKTDPGRMLSPSTIHTWKTKYLQELAKR